MPNGESLYDGPPSVGAFASPGGVPTRHIHYDNLTPTVVKVLLCRDLNGFELQDDDRNEDLTRPQTDPRNSVGPPVGMRVRLSSNESLLGASPAAINAAVNAAKSPHLYPDDQSLNLRKAIASHHGRDASSVAVGPGSMALIHGVAQLAAARQGRSGKAHILTFPNAYNGYALAAGQSGVGLELSREDSAGKRDVGQLLSAIGKETIAIMIDNPGNPTGQILPESEVRQLLLAVPATTWIVIDEAYFDYAHLSRDQGAEDYSSVIPMLALHPRALALRTFSKAFGLAGLRVGYALGSQEAIALLDDCRPRVHVSAVAQAAATAAVRTSGHAADVAHRTMRVKAWFEDELRQRGVRLDICHTNFSLVRGLVSSRSTVVAFQHDGIGLRDMAPYGLRDAVRISIGRKAHMQEVIDRADLLLPVRGTATATAPD